MLDFLNQVDTSLFLWLNGLHSPFWDKIMWFVSGKEQWAPLYAILLGMLIWRFRWRSIYILIGVALVITMADRISVEVFKEGVQRFRPTHNQTIKHLVHIVNNYYGGLYGFVSSHAANSFGIAVYLSLIFNRSGLTWLLLAWAALVSYSRIYLGVHYPGDILGGALLGAAAGSLVYYVLARLNNKFGFGLTLRKSA